MRTYDRQQPDQSFRYFTLVYLYTTYESESRNKKRKGNYYTDTQMVSRKVGTTGLFFYFEQSIGSVAEVSKTK